MRGFPDFGDPAGFDDEDAFVPAHLPDPGPFLDGHEVLTGDDHVAVHRVARECFEERRVYDMTFGYNLARLNRDRRHPDAGFRYAVETADPDGDGVASGLDVAAPAVLRAEFTPTTPFCPQSDTLTVASFRAWNGLAERHDFDLVRVRVAPMHHESEVIDAKLARLEERFVETGALREVGESDRAGGGFDGVDHGDPAEDGPF
ncbi:MAG TPA: hypothetical protein VKA37_09745 [Halobacteriales archaeon]|nr:hypothetical protein [Halobacteriales archaeon]